MKNQTEILTEAEIASLMNWRGPGAYNSGALRRVKAVVAEAVKREREACAKAAEEHPDGMHMLGGLANLIAASIRERD